MLSPHKTNSSHNLYLPYDTPLLFFTPNMVVKTLLILLLFAYVIYKWHQETRETHDKVNEWSINSKWTIVTTMLLYYLFAVYTLEVYVSDNRLSNLMVYYPLGLLLVLLFVREMLLLKRKH